MINKDYLELIHKDIDRIITPQEKQILDNYLKNNPEVERLYNDLLESEALLDKLPEMEPDENLKKRILNSIDYNRYVPETGRKAQKNLFRRRKPGFILSFSLGLIAGIIIIISFISNPGLINTVDENDISGTIGLTSEKVDLFNIQEDGISGTVEIIKGAKTSGTKSGLYHYGFNFNLSSADSYELVLQFNPSKISLETFTSPGFDNVRMNEDNGLININSEGSNSYSLLFSSENDKENFTLKIFKSGNRIYQRRVTINN
jgi:hypothetical protein